jgi:hypothetical protein
MFARLYHNAMELPEDKEKLKKRIDSITKSLISASATPHLLGMRST